MRIQTPEISTATRVVRRRNQTATATGPASAAPRSATPVSSDVFRTASRTASRLSSSAPAREGSSREPFSAPLPEQLSPAVFHQLDEIHKSAIVDDLAGKEIFPGVKLQVRRLLEHPIYQELSPLQQANAIKSYLGLPEQAGITLSILESSFFGQLDSRQRGQVLELGRRLPLGAYQQFKELIHKTSTSAMLLNRDSRGRTLLENLVELSQGPRRPEFRLPSRQNGLMSAVFKGLSSSEASQGSHSTSSGSEATGQLQRRLQAEHPAEYVRMMAQLSAPGSVVHTSGGTPLQVTPEALRAFSSHRDPDQLFQHLLLDNFDRDIHDRMVWDNGMRLDHASMSAGGRSDAERVLLDSSPGSSIPHSPAVRPAREALSPTVFEDLGFHVNRDLSEVLAGSYGSGLAGELRDLLQADDFRALSSPSQVRILKYLKAPHYPGEEWSLMSTLAQLRQSPGLAALETPSGRRVFLAAFK